MVFKRSELVLVFEMGVCLETFELATDWRDTNPITNRLRDRLVREQLQEYRVKVMDYVTILLIGGRNSGRSTIFKQFNVLFSNKSIFEDNYDKIE